MTVKRKKKSKLGKERDEGKKDEIRSEEDGGKINRTRRREWKEVTKW